MKGNTCLKKNHGRIRDGIKSIMEQMLMGDKRVDDPCTDDTSTLSDSMGHPGILTE